MLGHRKSVSWIPTYPLFQEQSPQTKRKFSLGQRQNTESDKKYHNSPAQVRVFMNQYSRQAKSFNIIKHRSEQKLPALNQCNIELTVEDEDQHKFIRVAKGTPSRLHKINNIFQQLNEKSRILSISEDIKNSQKKLLRKAQNIIQIKQPSTEMHKDRSYFIRNLLLHSNSIFAEQLKQKAIMNLLIKKLKQSQRTVNMKYPNLNEVKLVPNTKIEHQAQLVKCKSQDLTKKQEIMNKFAKKSKVPTHKICSVKPIVIEQQKFSGWNHINDDINQF